MSTSPLRAVRSTALYNFVREEVKLPCRMYSCLLPTVVPASLSFASRVGLGTVLRTPKVHNCSTIRYIFFSASAEMAAPAEISGNNMFGGFNKRYQHDSSTVGCQMKFAVYYPPAAASGKVPVRTSLQNPKCQCLEPNSWTC